MKNLLTYKNFIINEAVIMPKELKKVNFDSYEKLVKYGEKNDIDVVGYDEFYDSLSDRDKATAPPKDDPRFPFFALFHRERKKPMFVLKDLGFINMPGFSKIFFNVIGHEQVHQGQQDTRELTFVLPNPTDKKKYFKDKDEIMAFSWTIANGIKDGDSVKNFEDAIERLKTNDIPYGQEKHMWDDIRRYTDRKLLNKYRKYIYAYLQELYKSEDEKI